MFCVIPHHPKKKKKKAKTKFFMHYPSEKKIEKYLVSSSVFVSRKRLELFFNRTKCLPVPTHDCPILPTHAHDRHKRLSFGALTRRLTYPPLHAPL